MLRKALVILFVFTLLCLSLAGCNNIPLSLQIYSPEDGAEFGVNVQKVSGIVSNSKAEVQINSVEVEVAQDGFFYAYIDLEEGDNTIEVKATRCKDIISENITVTFTPSLAIYLCYPGSEEGVDYTVEPLTVNGKVNKPEARVKVNGQDVVVEVDGSFSARIQLKLGDNKIEAVAALDGQEDSVSLSRSLSMDGLGAPAPGWGIQFLPIITFNEDTILKAGETKSIDVTLETKNDILSPNEFTYDIYRTDGLPMPDGLEISIEPSRFTIYPNTTYHATFTISATPNATPGKYSVTLESNWGVSNCIKRVFNIHVLPPG